MLSGKDREVSQRVELIAACTGARREAGCNLVGPFLLGPSVAGRIGKCLN